MAKKEEIEPVAPIEPPATPPKATPIMGDPAPIKPIEKFDNKPFEALSAELTAMSKKLDQFLEKGITPPAPPVSPAPPKRDAKLFDEFDPTLGA